MTTTVPTSVSGRDVTPPSLLRRIARPLWEPTPRTQQLLATTVAVLLGIVVVTGAAVRLTGSGLGCPTWPTCTADSLHSSLTFHGLIEFGNRVISAGVFLVGILALALVVWRGRRRDVRRLVVALFAGYLAEAVLGGLTVLTRLNPLLVATHLLLALGLLWAALVVRHRLQHVAVEPAPRVRSEVRWLARALVAGTGAIVVVGTLVTGTGPWAGSRVDNRLPFDRRAITQLHSDLVLVVVGGVVVLTVLLHVLEVAPDIRRRAHWVVGLLVAQAAVGFVQYATDLPAWLIEIHVAGATAVWTACVLLALSTTTRPRLT